MMSDSQALVPFYREDGRNTFRCKPMAVYLQELFLVLNNEYRRPRMMIVIH